MGDEMRSGAPDSRASDRFDLTGAVELLGRRIGGAIVLAGALIGLGIYWNADEAPKYQAFAADGEVFRVNTESGTIIACNADRCTSVLERGQDLAEGEDNNLFRVPPAPPAAQLPGPAPQQRPTEPAPAAPQPTQPSPQPR